MNLILTAMYNTPGPSTPFAPGVNAFYIFCSLCGFSSVLWGVGGGRRVEREDASFIDNEKLCDLSCAWIV